LDFWKIIYIRSKHPMPHYVDASKHPHMTLCPVVFDFKNGINNTPHFPKRVLHLSEPTLPRKYRHRQWSCNHE